MAQELQEAKGGLLTHGTNTMLRITMSREMFIREVFKLLVDIPDKPHLGELSTWYNLGLSVNDAATICLLRGKQLPTVLYERSTTPGQPKADNMGSIT